MLQSILTADCQSDTASTEKILLEKMNRENLISLDREKLILTQRDELAADLLIQKQIIADLQ